MLSYRSTSRAYVVSPYFPKNSKEIVPELPEHCPCCASDSCKIVLDHLRERTTGPCLSLYVMRCKTHKIGFTLYPYGYYPYSRHTLAPVDMEGNLLTKSYDKKTSLFVGTLFEAATDAADGIAWKKESTDGHLQLRLTSQVRHMQRATILLSIAPENRSYLREEIAQILTISGQAIIDTSVQIAQSLCNHQCWGDNICNLLRQIPPGTLFERLAEAGASVGLWKRPLFVINNTLQLSSFHRVRMRGSP